MLGSPRIIAVDDNDAHLAGLAQGLSRNGAACLQIHFTGDLTGIKECPDVRIVFADLHLGTGNPSDHLTDFSTITGLLEDTIKPSGPYFIVLWTEYPEQASDLRSYLDQRLGPGVTKPFDVCQLPKADHIDGDGKIRDQNKLMQAIREVMRESPQVGAVIEWEHRVLDAAGGTVSSVVGPASSETGGERANKVGRILGQLAVAAVGKDHVDADRFRAINDALFPILADRISKMHSTEASKKLFQEAFAIPGPREPLAIEEAARLNRLLHIANAEDTGATERGAVLSLPAAVRNNFQDLFGIMEKDAAADRFRCKDFDSTSGCFRWILVQCQAACDYAQSSPGSLPFYLGLEFPEQNRASNKPPDSTWCGPMFEFDGEIRCLRVNAGFPLGLTFSILKRIAPVYRLRGQMLANLIYHVHSHGARPGTISFGPQMNIGNVGGADAGVSVAQHQRSYDSFHHRWADSIPRAI